MSDGSKLPEMSIRTRFAPSPTGVLHIGSVRTALFCWLYARHCGGKFILRIEDTDRERSTAENINAIFDGLTWLNIESDEEPWYQTRRFDRYAEIVESWLSSHKAYRCYCTKDELNERRKQQMAAGEKTRYDGRCRQRTISRPGVDSVVRFRNPTDGEVIVNDLVRGRVVFSNTELDDLIIARSDGTPTYNFTVVVDDSDSDITHVIRGDDHLNNTPRQMNMLQALGNEPPQYAHLPMILGTDGAKLSKRHGAIDVREYRSKGYLPEALLNYLVRLGWSNGDREVFSVKEMVELFDIADVNQSASVYNPDKLTWLNQQHIMAMPAEQLGKRLMPYFRDAGINPENGPDPVRIAEGYRERAETLVQMVASSRYCYEDFSQIDPAAAKKHLRPVVLHPLKDVMNRFQTLDSWSKAEISKAIADCAEAHEIKMGKLGQPLRVAVTGGSVSPPIDVTLALIGREKTLVRLAKAVKFVESRGTPSA